MKSISRKRCVRAVERFFRREMMVLAERMKREGREFFPVTPSAEAETYYMDRDRRTLSPEDFEGLGCESSAEFADRLLLLWRSQGLEELESLIPTLSKLAGGLYQVEEQQAEVSPFVYVMY